jgi:Tfp pilus assembly protein PilN
MLVGDVGRNAEVVKHLADFLGTELVPFRSSFSYPEHFPVEEYAANLGLALADRTAALAHRRLPASVLPSLNLMPERHMPRPLPLLQVAIFVPMLLFAYVTLNISERIEEVQAEETAFASQARVLELEARKQRLAFAAVAAERQDATEAASLAANLDAFIAKREAVFQTYASQVAAMLDQASVVGVIVSNFASQQDGFLIVGTAAHFVDVSTYAELLSQSNAFEAVKITNVERPDAAGSVTFQVQVSIKQANKDD